MEHQESDLGIPEDHPHYEFYKLICIDLPYYNTTIPYEDMSGWEQDALLKYLQRVKIENALFDARERQIDQLTQIRNLARQCVADGKQRVHE